EEEEDVVEIGTTTGDREVMDRDPFHIRKCPDPDRGDNGV
ncbi:hypothetical protein AB205_0111870, partial [Aquarana catesbeiana]